MPQVPANTFAIFIGLVMFVSTLIFIYTIVADHLEDDTEWFFWKRMRTVLLGRLDRNRVVMMQYARRRPISRRDQ
jgi:hypothetical protein